MGTYLVHHRIDSSRLSIVDRHVETSHRIDTDLFIMLSMQFVSALV